MRDYKYKASLCYLANPCIRKKKGEWKGRGEKEREGKGRGESRHYDRHSL